MAQKQQGLGFCLNLKGVDEAKEKLDALNAKLKECKGLIKEISGMTIEVGANSEPPADA